MYNFIFWVLYSANIEYGRSTAKFQASIIVLFALFVHLVLILAIIKKFYLNVFNSFRLDFFTKNKALEISFIALAAFLIYQYYTEKRINKIESKYSKKTTFTYPSINKIIVALIVFIPLMAVIIILSNLPNSK